MSAKYQEQEQSVTKLLTGLEMSLNSAGKHDWLRIVRAALNKAKDLEKRERELEAKLKEALMNCSIDNHGGGDDPDCKFCTSARALLKAGPQ